MKHETRGACDDVCSAYALHTNGVSAARKLAKKNKGDNMGNIASIHIEKGHVGEFFHNDRSKETKNSIFKENEVIFNRNAQEALELYRKDIEEKSKKYTERTKQKMQKKTITLLSAIVNIKSDTTLDDLEKFGKELEKKLGTRVYQIAIHRDEGHVNENGEKVINEHAHFLMSGLDDFGRSIRRKLTKQMLRELQDLTAETLGMQRGRSAREAKRKRLNTYEYKEAMKLKNQEVIELKKKLIEKDNEIEELKILKKELEKQISELRKKMIEFNKSNDVKEFNQEDYKTLSEIKKLLRASNLSEVKEKLMNFENEIKKRIRKRQKELIDKYSKEIGLISKEEVIEKDIALKIINTTCKTKTEYNIVNVIQENEKLKKENKELKEKFDKMKEKFEELKQIANKILRAKIKYYEELYKKTRRELESFYQKEQKTYAKLNERERQIEKQVEKEVGINPTKKVRIDIDF